MRKVTFAILGLSTLGAVAAASTVASAMPISSFAIPSSNAEQIRYVCNEWGRCWWRPNYRPYGYGYGYRYDDDGPRYYRRPYGYYGGPRYYGGYGGYGGWHRGWGAPLVTSAGKSKVERGKDFRWTQPYMP